MAETGDQSGGGCKYCGNSVHCDNKWANNVMDHMKSIKEKEESGMSSRFLAQTTRERDLAVKRWG